MRDVLTWIRDNKLTTVLLLVVGYLIFQQRYSLFSGSMVKSTYPMYEDELSVVGGAPMAVETMGMARDMAYYEPDVAPSTSENRLVIRDTSMSLQVASVRDTLSSIEQAAEQVGGFLVNSSMNVPEEAASGSITIRVPEEQRADLLETFRSMAVKVVSESVTGRDVTDQYEDISAQLDTYTKTKVKFETILENATEVSDILEVQRELVNLQSQIDSLKGRQQYLEETARLSKITIYVSTDEYALPYVPNESWRPAVVFKQAVRSLVRTFRSVADWAIWIVVYAPIWIVLWIVWRWWMKRKTV